MTSETVKEIIEAEEKAAEMKAQAEATAQNTLRDAEKQASDMKLLSAEECKNYRSTALSNARIKADAEYDSLIENKNKEAEQFVDSKINESDAIVAKIIGRIISGNC